MAREDWPPCPPAGDCTPEAVAFYKALPHLLVTSPQDPSLPADILAYKKKFVAPPALREEIIATAHGRGHAGINRTTMSLSACWWWPGYYDDVVNFIRQCPACISRQRPNLKDGPYHPLEQVYEPRQVVYLDLLGPISGIGSESKFVLTALYRFSRYLAVRPLKSKKSTDFAKAIHEIMVIDFLYPQRVITDRGSEFTSKEAQAAFARFGILVEYIPTAEHHLNLVERAHRSLWDIIRAVRMDNRFNSFKSALAEAAYAYNVAVHRSTGFAPATLHTGQLMFSPGILHLDNAPPLPPAATGPNHSVP